MPWKEAPDGMVTVWSPLLQLEVRFADGQLRFWDPKTARYLEPPEAEAEAQVESTEQALNSEKQARKVLEARIAEIEAIPKSPRKHLRAGGSEDRSSVLHAAARHRHPTNAPYDMPPIQA